MVVDLFGRFPLGVAKMMGQFPARALSTTRFFNCAISPFSPSTASWLIPCSSNSASIKSSHFVSFFSLVICLYLRLSPAHKLSDTLTIFGVNAPSAESITVPAAYGKHRFWRNTSVAKLTSGQAAVFAPGTLGFEWDQSPNNGFQPQALMRLSSVTVRVPHLLLDYGSTYGPGQATHSLTLYRHSSGALVFAAGTVQWSWGLDATHDNGSAAADVRMQQATVNLFADMAA